MLSNTPDTIHTTPLLQRRGALRFVRAQLTAIVVLCLAAGFAPQAFAQVSTCGATTPLIANQWKMVGVSCVPAAPKTVSSLFASNAGLGAANYNVTWVVWKRVYNNVALCPGAAPNDCYTKLTLTSAVAAGDAFWIYSTVAVAAIQFTGSATGANFTFPAQVSSDSNSRYYMFGNPYPTTKNWADFQWPVTLFGFLPYTGTTQQAIDNYGAGKNIYYWNGTNTYFTRDNTNSPNPAATFTAKQSAWIEFLLPADFISNLNVRVPGP